MFSSDCHKELFLDVLGRHVRIECRDPWARDLLLANYGQMQGHESKFPDLEYTVRSHGKRSGFSYLDRNRLVRIAPEILQELSLSQPSFSRISLETAHAMIDRYFVGGKDFWRIAEREKRDHHLEHVDPAGSRIAQFNACASQLVTAASLPHSIAGC